MTAALEGGEWSAAHPGRTLPPVKTRYPFLQEAGWAPGPVWTGGKSRPHRDSIPDRPARDQSLYRLSYPAHFIIIIIIIIIIIKAALKYFELDRTSFGAGMANTHNCDVFLTFVFIRLHS